MIYHAHEMTAKISSSCDVILGGKKNLINGFNKFPKSRL